MASTDTAPAAAWRTSRCPDDRFGNLQRPCPTCGEVGARIVYGYPSRVLSVAARQGKVVLGGCTYGPETHQCPAGHRWADPGSTPFH